MPKDAQSDPRKSFVPRYLPWVLGGVMLALYGLTLNHWVTLLNIKEVAIVSGWTWQPQVFTPLTLLATLPFRWLPAAHLPAALNLFSACCAAASLALLARCVAILPHDRTDMERTRERSDFSFLTGWVAWVPPIAAVIFAACGLDFWKQATSFSGESFELLWLVVILWQLLEYRLDEREARLYLAAFFYGAGLMQNWAMVGYFPVFLIMLIWLQGTSFFNLHVLSRTIFWGLAGLLLLLLLVMPLAARFSGVFPIEMGLAIKSHLHRNWELIKDIWKVQEFRHDLALISLTSLLPAFLMSIRWSSSFGDSSRVGSTFVHYLMHVVNALILGVLVWVTMDPPFSPRKVLESSGLTAPGLSFYFIGALCIGYYSGYFLLVFGKRPKPTKRNPRPNQAVPKSLLWFCPVVLVAELACLALGAGLLIYKNAPIVRSVNDDSLQKYAHYTAEKLPPDKAIALCDSDDPNQTVPTRAYLLQAELARTGRAQIIPVVDTSALEWPAYHKYLHQHFPKIWPLMETNNNVSTISGLRILDLLEQLSKSNALCYLHPSFGYYFERFYQVPHGLVYSLKKLPDDPLLPPALDQDVITENETFWKQVLAGASPAIKAAQHPVNLALQRGLIGPIMRRLHVSLEPNPNALLAGEFYSRSLNYLGVQIQRAGDLDNAAPLFRDAWELNSNNVVASANFAFNNGKTLRVGTPDTVNLSRVTTDQFGKYHNWNEVLAANGPYDETSFCYDNGRWFMRGFLFKQAAVQFNRVRQLANHCLEARLNLAQIYLIYRQPDNALEVLHDPLTRGALFDLTEFNSTPVNVLAASAHFQRHENAEAATLLESEMNRHPDDEMLLLVSAQVFNRAGLYTNALRTINRKLAHTPNDPVWLYGKGMVSLQVNAYDDAVDAFSRFLEYDTNNPVARFNRGLANFQMGRLNAARDDFRQLQAEHTNSFQLAYGLGEIAWRQHQTNEIIRNCRIYLANAPTNNVAEIQTVRKRLSQLGGQYDAMRVTHIITRLVIGGAQENTLATIAGLRQIPGLELKLISGPTTGPEGSLEDQALKIPGLLTIVPELVRPVQPLKDFLALRHLEKTLRRQKPLLVHTHSGKAGFLGRLAAKRAGVPVIIHHIHGPSFGNFQSAPANWIFTAAERRAARVTDHFFCSAEAMSRRYLAAGIGRPSMFTRIFSGFNLEPFLGATRDPALRRQLGLAENDFVIGKIGRLFRLKGHADLIAAFAMIAHRLPHARLLLLGDGVLRHELEAQARELGLAGKVVFAGLVPPAEVAQYVGIMDCLAHLSYREALSRALPQALATGKPVVAYDFDGADEVCLENQSGFVVRTGDTETAAQKLLQLAGDAALRERLGRAGQAFVKENFSVEKMVAGQYQVYLKLTAGIK